MQTAESGDDRRRVGHAREAPSWEVEGGRGEEGCRGSVGTCLLTPRELPAKV